MKFIKGVTFGYMSNRGDWLTEEADNSLNELIIRTSANTIILPVVVEQETIHSTKINWRNNLVLSDEEVEEMIDKVHQLGLDVILKPMLNVSEGTWRAHINFFDHQVVCEPKWSDWFASYYEFILHYAEIAERKKCEMFVIGCELVNSTRREEEWRELIRLVREKYKGNITYNCDKYQEEAIEWWDAVDVISSSGYYPIDRWHEELPRIKNTVEKYEKPFFFCEAGCPSRVGSEFLPNDWTYGGSVDVEVQKRWFQAMFDACDKHDWIQGYGLWDWKAKLYSVDEFYLDRDYALYGKPAELIVKKYYLNKGE
ncbi:1,4-beta-xylanase [Aerococcaceae bacterium zg-BR22]|uniref:glycoside hydrolase family 113 n=1 Tax=Aerococcaceae bacterium zg-1292 TaxID=2774330 RepID=UPI004062F7E1|nr:1,4-beta-xylanase [Aerococcaceae bacterium zg-BR22]